MIRILHAIGFMHCGGAENMIMNLYRNIDRSKLQFDFVVHQTQKGFYDDEIRELGGVIHYCPSYKVINHFEYVRWWNDFFSQHPEYKIIHGHIDSCANIYLRIAKKYGLVTIAHSHSTNDGFGIKAYIKHLLKFKFNDCCEYKFGCSIASNKWLYGKEAVAAGDCTIIHNAIDTELFAFDKKKRKTIREQFGIQDNQLVIGHIGRFLKVKNHAFVIKVFKEILNYRNDSVLILVGDGEETQNIKAMVKNLGIEDRVIFTGVRADVYNFVQGFDLLLFPSFYEGLSLVAVEAQSSGLPVLASTNVSNETVMTDIMEFLSLEEPVELWAKKAIEMSEKPRLDHHKEIVEKGYDIKSNAEWLQEFYISKYNER